jgi:hypothetical protein
MMVAADQIAAGLPEEEGFERALFTPEGAVHGSAPVLERFSDG